MKYSLVLTAAAGFGQVSATFGFGGIGFFGAKPFECPKNIDNKCKPSHVGGIGYGDAPLGQIQKPYDGFKYGGEGVKWQCGQGVLGRDIRGRTFGKKFFSAPCGKGSVPEIEPENPQDYFSMTKFQIDCDLPGEMQMEFDMPGGRKCRTPPKSCNKGMNYLENNQCGGAKKVRFHYKPKGGDKCNIGWHRIDLDCDNNCKPGMPGCPPCKPGQPGCPCKPGEPGCPCKPGEPGCPPQNCKPGEPGCPPCKPGQPGCPPQNCKPGEPGCPPCKPGEPGCPPQNCKPGEPGCPPCKPGEPGCPPQNCKPGEPGCPPCKPGEPGCPPQNCKPGEPGCPPQNCKPGEPGCPPCKPGEPGCGIVTPPVSQPTPGTPQSTVPPQNSQGSSTLPTVPTDVSTSPPYGGGSSTVPTGISTAPPNNSQGSSTEPAGASTSPQYGGDSSTLPTGGVSTAPPNDSQGSSTVPTGVSTAPPQNSQDSSTYPVGASTSPQYGQGSSTAATALPSSPVEEPTGPNCPGVVPSCLNTWIPVVSECKNSLDKNCYCKHSDLINKVYACIYANGETDNIIAEAIQALRGICAPEIPQNPAIITGGESITSYITVTGTPIITSAVYTTILVDATVTVPCVTGGTTISGSSTVTVIKTEVPVPQVTLPPPPKQTGGLEKPQVPGGSQPVAPPPAVTPPPSGSKPTPPPVAAGAANVRAGFGLGLAVMAMMAAL